jgi:hypothetical protein
VIKATIEQLAARLREFETENITSRRRVRELELDLEKCRADVARERTRVQAEIQKQLSQNSAKERDRKGKGRANEPMASSSSKPTNPDELQVWEARYKEVVDTKKGAFFPSLWLWDRPLMNYGLYSSSRESGNQSEDSASSDDG